MSMRTSVLGNTWRLAVAIVLLLALAACGEQDTPAADDADGSDPDPPGEVADDDAAADDDEEVAGEGDDAAVEEFYAGNTVTIVVATEPGGGFDTFARLYARHMSQYIPGEPTIVVENRPGAGHMAGLNHVYNVAPRDGTVIGTADGAVVLQQVMGAEGAEFDFSRLRYLGMPDAPVNMVLVARADAGIERFEQLLEDGGPELIVGISAPGTITADPAILARDVLGANINIVAGYEGTTSRSLAVEQGETEAFITSMATLEAEFAEQFDSGEWVVLLQLAEPGSSEYLDGVTTIQSLARDEEERQMLAVGTTLRSYVRPFFVHEEVPEERYAALKRAWELTTDDPAFIAEAEDAGRSVDPVDGEELNQVYRSFVEDTTDAMIERLREALGL